jgi:hypothetical protein
MPVMAMAGALALDNVVLPLVSGTLRAVDSHSRFVRPGGPSRRVQFVMFSVVIVYGVLGAMLTNFRSGPVLTSLTLEERDAMTWVGHNTDPDASVLVVTGGQWATDQESEWFPVLAERLSPSTVQGTEWLPDGAFDLAIERYLALQSCSIEGSVCLSDWSEEYGVSFSHVFVSKTPFNENELKTKILADCCTALVDSLRASRAYTTVFENDDVVVFERSPAAAVSN